jgi:hypothetical protein
VSVQHRKMRQEDIPACIELVASHPAIAVRYHNRLNDLGAAWSRLIPSEAANLVILEELASSKSEIWGITGAVFVDDDFIREVKKPPFFWIGAELARRVNSLESPVLSEKQIRDANSTDGLNILVLEGHIRPGNALWTETYYSGVSAFFEHYRGYRIKELIGSQADNPQFLDSMIKSGVMLLNPDGCSWTDSPTDLEGIVAKPHIIGLPREIAANKPGSWFSSVFDYRLPRFGFTRRQQQLLMSAFETHIDERLAEKLGISLSAVKKMWLDIYDRVGSFDPELALDHTDATRLETKRGKEKRRQLLSYLRGHPEELRPFSKQRLV